VKKAASGSGLFTCSSRYIEQLNRGFVEPSIAKGLSGVVEQLSWWRLRLISSCGG
jgi:hypothetical protein